MTGPGARPRRICAIHQPHYLPWLRYFDKIARADVFILLDDVQYSKNGWQNRNRIQGPGGPFLLTVPVRHGHNAGLPEVRIAGDRWRRAHLAALQSSYGRAPGHQRLMAAIGPVLAGPWERLNELNLALLPRLLEALAIPTPTVTSSSLGVRSTATARLVDLCLAVGATHYLSGAFAADAYLEPERFAQAGLGLLFHSWQAPRYRQPHPTAGFTPDLSIVDLIAAEDDRAAAILASAGGIERPTPVAAQGHE